MRPSQFPPPTPHTDTHTHTLLFFSVTDRDRGAMREEVKGGDARCCATCDVQITHMDGADGLADSASGDNLYLTIDGPPPPDTHAHTRLPHSHT